MKQSGPWLGVPGAGCVSAHFSCLTQEPGRPEPTQGPHLPGRGPHAVGSAVGARWSHDMP